MDSVLSGWTINAPAALEDVERVEKFCGYRLPDCYRRFILSGDGGQGPMGDFYIQAWSTSEIIVNDELYGIRRRLGSHVLGFATEGDYCFALNRNGALIELISFPLGCIAVKEVVVVGKSVSEGILRVVDGAFTWRDFVPIDGRSTSSQQGSA